MEEEDLSTELTPNQAMRTFFWINDLAAWSSGLDGEATGNTPPPAQYGPLVAALIGFSSTVVVTLIAAWAGYKRYLRERDHQREALLNALFGELANIFEHYSYAVVELSKCTLSGSDELRIHLEWSMYGTLHSTQEISRYGFLSAADIRLLLQLGLRVRNNDQLIRILLERRLASISDDRSLRSRMRYTLDTTRQLLDRLVKKRPKLESILIEIKKDLPAIHNQ